MAPDGSLTRRVVALGIVGGALLACWPLLVPVLYDTHDGHYAVYNAAQMWEAVTAGQIPPRWLPDLFGGRGIPHFVFYHPLSFYVVLLLHAIGVPFIAGTKVLYVLAAVLGGAACYLWLSERLSNAASLAGALAYQLAPFHLVEIHVKGDPPAVLAWAIAPALLIAIGRAARGTRYGVPAAALASAALVLAHSVTAFLWLPFAAAWAFAVASPEPARSLTRISAGVGLGAALSAFGWLPALAEKSLVHIESPAGILFFDFREHFLAAWQWISPLWGYHGSFAGPRDDMSLQIGPVQAAALLAAVAFWRRLEKGQVRLLTGFALGTAGFGLLLTLGITRPLWEAIAPMRLVQFPWRYLAPVALGLAALVAIAVERLPARLAVAGAAAAPAAIAVAFGVVQGNRWYLLIGAGYAAAGLLVAAATLRARGSVTRTAAAVALMLAASAAPWSAVPFHSALRGEPAIIPLTEADLLPERVRLGVRRTTARDDYLPRTVAAFPPRDAAQEYFPPADAVPPAEVEVLEGDVTIGPVVRSAARFAFDCEVRSPARLALNLHAFPGWRVNLPTTVDAEGRIVVELPAGRHSVDARFRRTADRIAGETFSALGGILVLSLLAVGYRRVA